MKNILLVLVVFSLAFAGCKKKGCTDLIATNYDPKAKQEDGSCVFPSENIEIAWPVNSNLYRNVLIEDYTGHLCTNCPAAAEIASSLETDNPGRVFVASIHASPDGSFQGVQPPDFITDFTTNAGTTYTADMPGFLGNPMGTVNRTDEGLGNTVWYFDSDWGTATSTALTAPLQANLQLQYDYSAQNNELTIYTETEFKSNMSGNFNLILYLVRDTVISSQEMNTGATDLDYVHRSVLSDNINGNWGTNVLSGAVSNGDFIYENFIYQLPDPTIDLTFNINNLSIITYLCNRTSFEVIQVIKSELAP